jgi:hypothetical protein
MTPMIKITLLVPAPDGQPLRGTVRRILERRAKADPRTLHNELVDLLVKKPLEIKIENVRD